MARDQRSDLHGISIIAENKPHANHKTHMQTMKVYNWPDHRSFAKVFFFFFFFRPLSSVHLFQSNQTLWSDGIRGPTRFGKALDLIFPKLSSQNMRGFDHATIFCPSFHGLRTETAM